MPDRDKILKVGDSIVVIPGKSVDEIFLMVLCLVTSVPIIFGAVPAPGSIDAFLNRTLVVGWSIALAAGSLTVLVSFLMKDRITGIIVEQFGSVCIGVAATIYAIAIYWTAYDKGGLVPGSIILGFAIARFIQVRQHQKVLKKVRLVMAKIEEGEVHGN